MGKKTTSLLTERRKIRYRMSYKFDVPSVYDTKRGIHFFPQDIKDIPLKSNGIKKSIQGVFYDYKWKQDVFYLPEEDIIGINIFFNENVKGISV